MQYSLQYFLLFLIMNITNLTVYSRRREVGIMKFVGATDWFIRWPFIIEGMVIGLLGAILSVIGVYFIFRTYICASGSWGTILFVPVLPVRRPL